MGETKDSIAESAVFAAFRLLVFPKANGFKCVSCDRDLAVMNTGIWIKLFESDASRVALTEDIFFHCKLPYFWKLLFTFFVEEETVQNNVHALFEGLFYCLYSLRMHRVIRIHKGDNICV